jgi:hypothetical protein
MKEPFTVVFYGSKTFCCKTAQFSERRREPICLALPLKSRLRNNPAPGVRVRRCGLFSVKLKLD